MTPPPPPPDTIALQLGASAGATYYGPGADDGSARTLPKTSSFPVVANTKFFAPSYYSTDGYAALGVSGLQFDPAAITQYPARWAADALSGGTAPPEVRVEEIWAAFTAQRADLRFQLHV